MGMSQPADGTVALARAVSTIWAAPCACGGDSRSIDAARARAAIHCARIVVVRSVNGDATGSRLQSPLRTAASPTCAIGWIATRSRARENGRLRLVPPALQQRHCADRVPRVRAALTRVQLTARFRGQLAFEIRERPRFLAARRGKSSRAASGAPPPRTVPAWPRPRPARRCPHRARAPLRRGCAGHVHRGGQPMREREPGEQRSAFDRRHAAAPRPSAV